MIAAVEGIDDFEEYDGEPTSATVDNISESLVPPDHLTPAHICLGSIPRADNADDEWAFESFEDDPVAVPSAEHELSRKPSTMSSSSRSSKRGHDEVDVDEEEDEGSPHSSPGMSPASPRCA